MAKGVQAQTPVKIALSVPDVSELLSYLADAKGFFKAEGLDAELVQFSSGPAAAQAISAGAVQVASADIFAVLDSYVAGRDLVAIWSIHNLPSFVWFGPAKYASIKDLKGGGKMGISSVGSMTYYVSSWALTHSGLNPKTDITFMALGGPLQRVAALQAGQVDVIPASYPGVFLLEKAGFKPLLELKDLMPEFSNQTLYARRSTLDRDDAIIKKVIIASTKAKFWAEKHPDEAATILREHLGGKLEEADAYRKTVDIALPYYPNDGRFPDESLDVFLGFYKEQGKIKDLPPHSAFTDYRFVEYFKQHPIK